MINEVSLPRLEPVHQIALMQLLPNRALLLNEANQVLFSDDIVNHCRERRAMAALNSLCLAVSPKVGGYGYPVGFESSSLNRDLASRNSP